MDASSILATCDTEILFGLSPLTITKAPAPVLAYQRRKSAGALTTPVVTTSLPSLCF